MDWEACPRPAEGLQINPVTDGYVVYDPARERVHYLNHTAVVLLELCDGEVKAARLPSLLQAAYDLPEPPIGEVADCLDRLLQEGLLH